MCRSYTSRPTCNYVLVFFFYTTLSECMICYGPTVPEINYSILFSYDDRLKECGLTTLETRRLRGDQIEVFKILNGHENIDPNIFFKIKTGKITRGHDFTLVNGQTRLDFRKYSFSQRTVNEWNKLSADCVHSSSVNMFKNRIDNYLVRAGYT